MSTQRVSRDEGDAGIIQFITGDMTKSLSSPHL